jgi:hypothetical protein
LGLSAYNGRIFAPAGQGDAIEVLKNKKIFKRRKQKKKKITLIFFYMFPIIITLPREFSSELELRALHNIQIKACTVFWQL